MVVIATVNARGPLGRRILARVRTMRWIAVWESPTTAPAPRVVIVRE